MFRLFCVLIVSLSFAMVGCGGSTNCLNPKLKTANIFPSAAVADHNSAPPGNQVSFNATGVYGLPSDCVTIAKVTPLPGARWSVSDSTKVSLTPVATPTHTATALATCLGATSAPVTITASAPVVDDSPQTVSATATLTCN